MQRVQPDVALLDITPDRRAKGGDTMADAEYKRQRTKWLKAHGICVSCGNADAEPERVRCRACLDKNAAASRQWQERHPEYRREYLSAHRGQWRGWPSRQGSGAGRLYARIAKIRKPDGTCRRKGCWESALPFSCWCDVHRKEMRERRCQNDLQRQIGSISLERSLRQNGW